MRTFTQVDVFTATPLLGNPVAVVLDAEGMSDAEMAQFANWTNLSETTFVLPPTDPAADYRVRIFTPDVELPFAGHPTIGTCHAWLEAGGVPKTEGTIMQECGVGLVTLRHAEGRLAFAAPPLIKGGPVDEELLAPVCAVLDIDRSEIVDAQWADNGPGWIAVMLESAEAVLALRPNFGAVDSYDIGVVGSYPLGVVGKIGAVGMSGGSPDDGGERSSRSDHVDGLGSSGGSPDDGGERSSRSDHVGNVGMSGGSPDSNIEVRAFFRSSGQAAEDPVTGSLNAALAQWLLGNGTLSAPYVAAQGTALGRAGRVYVDEADGEIWVGGDAVSVVSGTVAL